MENSSIKWRKKEGGVEKEFAAVLQKVNKNRTTPTFPCLSPAFVFFLNTEWFKCLHQQTWFQTAQPATGVHVQWEHSLLFPELALFFFFLLS